MIGKTDIADTAVCQVTCDPVLDSDMPEIFPLMNIGKHMHQIVIYIICLQSF